MVRLAAEALRGARQLHIDRAFFAVAGNGLDRAAVRATVWKSKENNALVLHALYPSQEKTGGRKKTMYPSQGKKWWYF